MIESIQIRQVATFDDHGIDLRRLKKINFFYGVNGCGKTTISRFINTPKDLQFAKCSINWKADSPVKSLVYNKDFRESNFGRGAINGVFTIGKATKEQIEIIEKKQLELLEIRDKGILTNLTLNEITTSRNQKIAKFKEELWVHIYKKYKSDFKDAFKGSLTKESFKTRLLEEYKNSNAISFALNDLKEKANIIFGAPPTVKPTLSSISFDRIVEIENDSIWEKKIIGRSDVNIANIIQKLNIHDWVNEGRKLIHQNDRTCPFCQQQTISIEFLYRLEEYFDKTFTEDLNKVNSYMEEYTLINRTIVQRLQLIETIETSNGETKICLNKFSSDLKTLESQSRTNIELIQKKAKEPSRIIKLLSLETQLINIQDLITDANLEIKIHNDLVANYSNQKIKLTRSIWKFIIEENKFKIQRYIEEYNRLGNEIQNLINNKEDLRKRYYNLNEDIKHLSKNVTSVQPSVEEINRLLKSYGFENFRIVPYGTGIKKNQYQIEREDGTLAESTLSEGEITFITFLYFLQLTKGSILEESVTEDRIVVIDDPVSSLDSNVLFVVSSLIKELIKAIENNEGCIKQILLLTHNVFFHRDVSFVDGKSKKQNHSNFWIIRKNNNVSSIHAYESTNPIQNSYELLWQELREKNSDIIIQNIMRQIIENYFRIIGKMGDDELIKKFPSGAEQEICRSLIYWIKDGSCCFPDNLFIDHQSSMIIQYFEVFKNIFDYSGHIEHYNMMMKEAV